MNTKETERDWIEEIGKGAYGSIEEMVGALLVDYERLEELREDRDSADDLAQWALDNPEESAELKELESAAKIDGYDVDEDEAREHIQEDALSVRVFGERTEGQWEATSYELLLTTGGPAVRIVGDLDQYSEPSSARLEVQDWFKPWSEYYGADRDILMAYAQCFYFGE